MLMNDAQVRQLVPNVEPDDIQQALKARRPRRTFEQITAILAERGIAIANYRKGHLQADFTGVTCGHSWRVTASSVINSQTACPVCWRIRNAENYTERARRHAC